MGGEVELKKRLSTIEATALLIGTQIGAGVLGLPYALRKLGFLGIGMIVGVGFLTLATAIAVLRLSELRGGSLSEIAGWCLGKVGAVVMLLSLSVLIYGAMVAYISSSGELINSLFGFDRQVSSYVFWAIFSLIVLLGLKLSGEVELWMNFVLVAALAIGAAFVFPEFKVANMNVQNFEGLWGAAGVIAFAFVSHMLVPEILRGVGDERKAFTSVKLGFIFPMIFYSIFVLSFVGAFGAKTPEIVTTVLERRGSFGRFIGVVLPLTAIGTSYIGVSFAQMRNIEGLFKTSRIFSWLIAVLPPLLIYIAGMKSFVKALWIGGSFGGAIYAGILPAMMYAGCCRKKGALLSFAVYSSGVLFAILLLLNLLDLVRSF